MDQWSFCMGVKDDIINLSNQETYDKYGQQILDILMNMCSENFEVVRWPEEQEVLDVIAHVTTQN